MEFGIEKCNIVILKRGIKGENCDFMSLYVKIFLLVCSVFIIQ